MKKLTPVLILVVMLAAIACTKFKDDPFISLRSPQHRLLGSWHIVAFEVNGADSLSDLFSRTKYATCDFTLVYDKGNSVYKWIGCIDNWTAPGTFEGKQFYFHDYFIRYGRINSNYDNYTHFDVLKLYRKDFWIQTTIDGKNYLIKFKKQ